MQILFCNNYSMSDVRAAWSQGAFPAHHLWGADGLEARGWPVTFVPCEPTTRLGRAARRAGYLYGDPDQEARIWRLAHKYPGSVCYSANSRTTRMLQATRAAHAWRTPICCVFHHRVPTGRSMRFLLNGVDAVICLNRRAERTLTVDLGIPRERVTFAPWGPDLRFAGYHRPRSDDGFILSAGKTKRDLDTLLAALPGVAAPARVYSMEARDGVPSNVELVLPDIQPDGRRLQFEFESVLRDLRSASIVAIPLAETNKLAGLTELNDALALGKPVVMTRSDYLEVDIEAIGCGRWVDPGDSDGWRGALAELSADPGLRDEMGATGRAFAEKQWNYELFTETVVCALESLGAAVARPRRISTAF